MRAMISKSVNGLIAPTDMHAPVQAGTGSRAVCMAMEATGCDGVDCAARQAVAEYSVG